MQKAILTFTDGEDSLIDISLTFEPEITDETRSGAACCALRCMDFIVEELNEKGKE